MFNENSAVVECWVRLVKSGTYQLEDVPNLSNLKEVVTRLVSE